MQVTNDKMNDIVLHGQTVLGSLELICLVRPLEVRLKDNLEVQEDNWKKPLRRKTQLWTR